MTEIPHNIIEESVRLAFNFRNVDDLKREIARVLHAERLATSKRVEEEAIERCRALSKSAWLTADLEMAMDATEAESLCFGISEVIEHLPRKYELRDWPDWRTQSQDAAIEHVKGKHD
jgi:hypothetical protein